MTARSTRRGAGRLGLLALLLLLSAAPAQAAAPSLVQIRVDRKLACSGSLVAPTFVLTAGHCTRRKGRAVTPARMLVVAGRGAVRVAKVATVIRAPRIAGRRPDLALVQTTSPSVLKPAAVASDYTIVRGRARVKASGWKTNRRALTVSGRLGKAKVCGRAARRGKLRCATLRGRAPARKCRDGAGGALVTGGRLVGVGTRSARGCRKRARMAYEDVASPAVLEWVATAIAPATLTPTPPPPISPPVDPFASYVGTFRGPVSQDNLGNTRAYSTTVKLDRTGPAGEAIGSSGYAEESTALPGCGGALNLINAGEGGFTLLEQLTFGQDSCVDGGTVVVQRVAGEDALSYSWSRNPEDGRASGVLQRVN